ncbi:hypothetical protein B0H66DRAFT_590975 [Apodospora peruviana]|uniref:Rhodopsin domain-containing protein n=1 Tax=Apodospora peruviana TaxID=516989 RepID=A0AAE0I618_9PEZI|nr:hypothetical protein B0H66DRAFT_590975 [Apodospora peruviana]
MSSRWTKENHHSRIVLPGLTPAAFLGALWAVAILSLIFLAFRLYSRFRGPRRLYLDDYLVILASILILSNCILLHWITPDTYRVLRLAAGLEQIQADFPVLIKKYGGVYGAHMLIFSTTLAAVKLSFLVHFRRLGWHMDRLRFVWWPVLLFVIATWAVMIGNTQFKCYFTSAEEILAYCNTPEAVRLGLVNLAVSCSLDVVSDLFIMAIPFILLWKIQIPTKRKLIFIGLVSLILVTMIISITRALVSYANYYSASRNDALPLMLWSSAEPCVAVMVACLSAFPHLFGPSSKPVYKPTESWLERVKGKKSQPPNNGGVRRQDEETNVSLLYGHNLTIVDRHLERLEFGNTNEKKAGLDPLIVLVVGASNSQESHQLRRPPVAILHA